ncbi:protein phosphatase 1 regulatory subunit 26 [Parambassis ranga]|uniref:Protein phosphatase 1 regulatory subunit 26 n=1 Tax=Parambassis ranga TaxID=210632 RepID=A0A6P7JDC7_9TELE|nr:protein phosphatase 1 regulatory subunit 26 [Parambassis ranga]
MYLMNVPPVVAAQTEWRTCGPPGGYSLPVCFNDSEPELSTRGTPISDKVQMIIESLRSTQSSLEMGDEIEGNVLSGQEGHPQVCRVAAASFVGTKSKSKSSAENPQVDVSSPNNHHSSDSDSDDSVDRGIEEAILEYLKEKDDHKRKTEPCPTVLTSSKIPRKTPSIPEVSQQSSDSNTCLVASNQLPKIVKPETHPTPAVVPIKKYIKNKALLSENTVKNFDLTKSTIICSREQEKSPSKTANLISKPAKCPVKVEEDSNDSSSDDGIEEAIQRYQLEKKEQQNKKEAISPHAFKEESDSTSDDGIEEAIRCYQLEQLKEKSVLQPFLHKQKALSKSLIHTVGSTGTENTKKNQLRKKRGRTEKEVKSFQPPPASELPDSSKDKGNGLLSFKLEGFQEQPVPALPKANTTAELMCAEAILDISKTVMPGAFHGVGLGTCAPTESSLQAPLPEKWPYEESNDSSIDSEDGIELEIRKFLEQKAQMHKQPSSSAVTQEPHSAPEPEKVKANEAAIQKKPHRLSLTQRRKHKDKSVSIPAGTDDNVKEKTTKPLPEHARESSHPIAGLHKTDQSGDKSSSLDSDEDLDTAIKDLLKTKKKSKKKMRDLKRKSRKRLRDVEPLQGNTLQTKKFKPDPVSKFSALKTIHKNKEDTKNKSGLSKKSASQQRQAEILKGAEGQGTLSLHNVQAEPQMKEDESSVDSDDSIEQEIRRFLAEKAKAERSKDEDVSQNGATMDCTAIQNEDIKQENQLAEIPQKTITPLSGQSPLSITAHGTAPQSLLQDISTVSPQSLVQSCSLSLLEPADGAGAARTEQRRPNSGRADIHDSTPQTERVRPVLSPRSESNKWRQSLGLPISDDRPLNRTPFHITLSEISKTASASPTNQSGGYKLKTPVGVWSSSRMSQSPFQCSPETAVNATPRSSVLNLFSTARQHPRMSLMRSLTPGNRSQCSIEGEKESMVHMSKDKSVFVELEANRTNHVQVQSREWSEGKERADMLSERKREGESVKIDNKEVHLARKEEEFTDGADCESGNRRNPEKKQGFSTLSLSSAIDPGFTFRPYIALTSEDRCRMVNRRHLDKKCDKEKADLSSTPVQKKSLQHVKRKLHLLL